MSSSTRGFSTIECLVALVLLAIGILGSAGTMALAVRAVHAGAAASSAARLITSVRDSLAAVAQGGGCSSLSGGDATGSYAIRATWRVSGSAVIELTVTRPALRGTARDTVTTFITCS